MVTSISQVALPHLGMCRSGTLLVFQEQRNSGNHAVVAPREFVLLSSIKELGECYIPVRLRLP